MDILKADAYPRCLSVQSTRRKAFGKLIINRTRRVGRVKQDDDDDDDCDHDDEYDNS